VTYEQAVKNSSSPSDFALLFRGVSAGGTGSGEEDEFSPRGSSAGSQSNEDFQLDRFGK
jgi:hypothetical protein